MAYVPSVGTFLGDVIVGVFGGAIRSGLANAKTDRTVACEIEISLDGVEIESRVTESVSGSAVNERLQGVVVGAVNVIVEKIAKSLDAKISTSPTEPENPK